MEITEWERKEAEELKAKEAMFRAAEEASRHETEQEAIALVRRAIAKTVELAPERIDDALIAKAVGEAKQTA